MIMTTKQKDEIIDILENLPYWDTCPQDYKDRIPELVNALSKVNNVVLDDVIKCEHDWNYHRLGEKRSCNKCNHIDYMS